MRYEEMLNKVDTGEIPSLHRSKDDILKTKKEKGTAKTKVRGQLESSKEEGF